MIKLIYRRLLPGEAGAAADLHRLSGALIPGYDAGLHTPAEFHELYRDKVLVSGPVWGAFEDAKLKGFVALLPGWIEHLYVDPDCQGQGVGTALVKIAQREQDSLRLYTFQSNVRARQLYERHGFQIVELTDGQRNEENMPDVTYHWERG